MVVAMRLPARDPESVLADDRFVRSLANGLLCDRDRAEDVVQETWLAACRKAVPPRTTWRQWLSGAACRLVLRQARSEARRRRREREAARADVVPSESEILAREETRRRVVEAV